MFTLAKKLILAVMLIACAGAADKKAAPSELAPHPVDKTFYVSGVSTPAQVEAITTAIAKLPSVTAVKELTPASGYVRVAFDTHRIASHLVAQTIMDQGPFTVTLKFEVPEYTRHTAKLDAHFANLLKTRAVKIEPTDRSKGRFVLTYLPIKPDPADPRKIGFNPGHLGHPIHDAPPKGLGLKLIMVEAPRADGSPAKGKSRSK